MNTETITVQYVNQPKPGKKMGSIKTQDGRYLGCWPNLLTQFQPGGSYVVQTETTGDFTKIKSVGGGQQSITHASAPAAETVRGNGYGKPANGNDSRMIFITGVVGRAMGSGNFSIGDLTNLTLAAAEAYAALDGGGDPRPEPPPHESDAPF